ncbi:AI-2E family transporter [Alysiella filiformis]|uniref:Predicted PurR-regulated permease PerM n=1 Tax=Alysiella filiformis DSM 16848 TaxID=1120981 RepID=A0A286EDN5_9NEIS|nr:AI-2E family transporter [Alysiella filiformis]QMT31711.1 AI-2E family transporter [Alysiella filiformis]UBQ55278.1 AI-2E family transporter [Alysiella filiformis DSM 16848]SOD69010.1 Predicted PurR-regulated permease PerM [Alysiella filiformis DSM 16848]
MYLPNKRRWLPWLAGFLVLAFLVIAFHLLRDVLAPFITAAVLAYILNPLVGKLESKGVKRTRASMWVMALSFGLLLGLLLVIVPMLVKQVQSIVAKMPMLLKWIQNIALPWLNSKLEGHITLNNDTLIAWLQDNASNIQNAIQNTLSVVMQQGGSLAGSIGNLALLPLILYYFLLDWERWAAGLRLIVPRRYIDTYSRISGSMDTVLGEFLRGQLTVMLIMGLIYGLGLMMVGLDSGFAIGMVAGILVFVPYLGAFTGLLLATLAAVLQFGSWAGLFAVWGVFAVGQFLESFFITPKIVGDRIGLSPFWVIFALMAFGNLLGFVGMLVALPLAAICLVLLREGKTAYLDSRFYRRTK